MYVVLYCLHIAQTTSKYYKNDTAVVHACICMCTSVYWSDTGLGYSVQTHVKIMRDCAKL